MKLSILIAVAGLSLAGGAFAADAPRTQTICLSGGGQQAPATCHGYGGGSRLAAQDEVCSCPGASQQVKAPTCRPGQVPPAESAAYDQARLKAVSHGSLEGATWQGKPMCVNPTYRSN